MLPSEEKPAIEKVHSLGKTIVFRGKTVFGDIKTYIFALDRVKPIGILNLKFIKMATKKAKKKSTRKPSAAFMKPLTPSPALAEVVGSKAMPRTEVVKKMWAYIKKNKLQDSKNRRMINADAKLKPIFGGKNQVSMFDMAKHLAKNLK
jgi:hypothetical protein